MKENRIKIAQDTLQILHRGSYEIDGKEQDIAPYLNGCIEKAALHRPVELKDLVGQVRIEKKFDTKIEVVNETTLNAGRTNFESGKQMGVLNFASARNPGGGFMNGAQSQEESIARSSSLYPSIDQFSEMYKHNRKHKTYLYSDYMIYSPEVVVFKDDSGNLLESPYFMDVLTSPAVNVSAMPTNAKKAYDQVEETMLRRMDMMLALFVEKRCDTLILGAWGCGVFRNDPKKIANYFHQYISEGGKYDGVFEKIVFAVLDRNKSGIFDAFRRLEQ